jgi:hypothetical protein
MQNLPIGDKCTKCHNIAPSGGIEDFRGELLVDDTDDDYIAVSVFKNLIVKVLGVESSSTEEELSNELVGKKMRIFYNKSLSGSRVAEKMEDVTDEDES